MLLLFRVILASAALILVAIVSANGQTQRAEIETIVKDYLAKHPEEIERVVKQYLITDPDVLKDALSELRQRVVRHTEKSSIVRANAEQLLNSSHQVTLGNPKGDVTIVEFFDYNCGFCKRALSDMISLLKDDLNLRVVLKEFPILGPGSLEAARIAVAVRMQDPDGQKYLAFHQKLLGGRGHADASLATSAAQDSGVDMERLARDVTSEEVRNTLDENMKLARALGITGTPSYVIGDAVVPGAVGLVALEEAIRAARN